MHKTYEALLDRFDELHRAIKQALDEMSPEALDWVPGPDMNCMCVLVVHLAGAERYWVGDVVWGELSFRDREAEFRVRGLSAEALKQRILDAETYERLAFEAMSPAELEQERTSPRDGKKYTVAWALAHALEHTALHVGHIQILHQMWKQQHPAG